MPLDLIIHGPPGSAPPVLGAAFLQAVAEAGLTSGPWTVCDRGGDPGVDAMEALSQRRGDGTVLSTCTPVFIQAPLLRGGGLTHRDMTPIARMVGDVFYIVVPADGPYTDAPSFLKGIQGRKTRTGGYFKGGLNHLLGLAIAEGTGAEVEFDVVADEPAVWAGIQGGSLDWGCGVAAEVLPHVENGTLRMIAVLADRRQSAFPEIPTLAETGLPVSFKLWRGLIGPPGLTEAQCAFWVDVADRVRATTAWQDYLRQNGQEDMFLGGTAFGAFLDAEWAWYAKHLAMAGLLSEARQ